MMKLSLLVFGILSTVCTYAEGEHDYTFMDIRKMTDISYSNAIPVLEEYLQIESGDIRKYAAAQSLFLMDTPETRSALAKHLSSEPLYNFQQSIRYAFHWSMLKADKRDEFIRKYHLCSTSDQLVLEINTSAPTNQPDKIEITLSIQNTSEQTLRLYKPTSFGRYILLISSTGEVMRPAETAMPYTMPRSPEEMYVEVSPGKSFEISFQGELKLRPLRWDYTRDSSYFKETRDVLVLEIGSYIHVLEQGGIFRVYGQYDQPPMNNPPFDNIWTGRVVSEPHEIKLEPLLAQQNVKTEPDQRVARTQPERSGDNFTE